MANIVLITITVIAVVLVVLALLVALGIYEFVRKQKKEYLNG